MGDELDPAPPEDKGSVPAGCAMGCLVQVIAILISVVVGIGRYGPSSKLQMLSVFSWGVTQWLAVGPMISWQSSRGKTATVKGLIITGAMGTLISSACATMALH